MKNSLAVLFALMTWNPASAATFTVENLADSGPGSLRQAVLAANAAAGADEIVFTVAGTITLTSGEIPITGALVVDGPGASAVTVSGNDFSRIFFVESPAGAPVDVTLSGLTLTRGYTPFGGGAVVALGENLTILDSVISDGRAGATMDPVSNGCGGNVALEGGLLRIVNSRVTGGLAEGVGFSYGGNLCVVSGSLSLERSTVSGGAAREGGGLYFSQGSTAEVLASTISGNAARSRGGGVYIDAGELRFLDSTVSGNTTDGIGGGLYALNWDPGSLVVLRLTTFADNAAATAGGGLGAEGQNGGFELDHALLTNNTPEDINLSGSYTANYSLVTAPDGPPASGSNNIFGVYPTIGPLANNGGPTPTHALPPGSQAINAGNPAIPSPPPTDQRGFPRIANGPVDIGAVEAQGFAIDVPTLSEWSILILSALLLAVGVWKVRAL